MRDWRKDIEDELASLEGRSNLRRLRALDAPQRAEILFDGRPVLNFSSNNYLGMADRAELAAAAQAGMARWGIGGGGARLIAGSAPPHRALEAGLARWKGSDGALLFPSGYQANAGIIPALCGAGDLIFSDQLNHASLIDGSRLSRADVHVYRHLDLEHLSRLLQNSAGRDCRRLVISESLFSMDGDRLDLVQWSQLARQHGAMTLLDEAHAIGVLGPAGAGLATAELADLQVGTLGKAFGVSGAFVCASRLLLDLLINRCRSFIFSTAVNIPTCLAASAALEIIQSSEGESLRRRLDENIDFFVRGAAALGLPLPRSHIIPLGVREGDNAKALALSQRLLDRGIYAQAIRPPTVPHGTARLRWTLMATHTKDHLDRALAALAAEREDLT